MPLSAPIAQLTLPLSDETNTLSIYYHNASGIRSKSREMYLSVLENEYDVICITETWLTSSHNSAEYFPPDYYVFRRDRYTDLESTARGGGVLLAVSKDIRADIIDLGSNELEILAVKLAFNGKLVLIVTVYIPYGSSANIYGELSLFFSNQLAVAAADFDSVMILGDLNFPKIKWLTVDDELLPFYGDLTSDLVMDSICSLGLRQINNIENQCSNILDLVFIPVEVHGTIIACNDLGGSSSIFHIPLHIQLIFENCVNVNVNFNSSESFNFKKGNYNALNEFLDNINWDRFKTGSLDAYIDQFYKIMNLAIEQFIPRSPVVSSTREPWFNSRLSGLKNRKSKAHKKYKLNPSVVNYEIFSALRSQFKILNRFLFNLYIVEIESNIRNNPKCFWSYVDSKRNCRGIPSQMSLNSLTASDPQSITDMFASFFENVYVPSSRGNDEFVFSNNPNILFQFTTDDVLHALLNVNVNMSCGPDKIHPLVLKKCASVLVQPLTDLFNLSLKSGVFPSIWKSSFIKPIFKSGRRTDIENYRGISILSAIPKLFESMVKDRIFFLIKNSISVNQHGFYPGRSTVTNLALFTNFLTLALEGGDDVEVVFSDFSKAFDKIDHVLLVKKLEQLNKCDALPLKWIFSYLTNRTQKVFLNNILSRDINVLSGVPQGSHIGPLLFIAFIDDVKRCFKHCKFLIYADDVKIFCKIRNDRDLLNLQQELNVFCDWCSLNKLCLNVSKCKVMNFSRRRYGRYELDNSLFLNGVMIERVHSFLDLGVLFSRNLSFKDHIDRCINKANSMLGFLIRFSKDFHDPYTLKVLFASFVRSHLEYASIVWNPYYNDSSNRIESIQKRFMLFALRRLPREVNAPKYVLPPYLGRCLLLNIEPLFVRRQISCAIFVRDVIMGRIDCSQLLSLFSIRAPVRSLRYRGLVIDLHFHGSNFGMSDPIFNSSRVFNNVSTVFDFNLSRDEFKRLLKNLFIHI